MANHNGGNSSSSGGIGFCSLLGIVFIVLKLCGVINWSWVWVLVPLWGSIALALVIIVSVLTYYALFDRRSARKK